MQRRSGWSRAFRAAWRGLCGVAVLAIVALAALHTAPIRDLLLRRIVAAIDEAIAGRLDVAELELHLTTFSMRGLVLEAPGGRVVATAERLDGVPLWPLVHHRIVLNGAQLRGVRISATVGPDGVDLFAAGKRVRRTGGGGGGGLEIESLSVLGGSIEVVQQLVPGLARRLDGEIGTGWIGRDGPLEPTRIDWRGPRLDPLPGGYEAALVLHRKEDGGRIEIAVRNPAVTLAVDLDPVAHGRRIGVKELGVSPEGGRALWGSWPLRAAARAQGSIVAARSRTSADVLARIGSGEIRIRGDVGDQRGGADRLRVDAAGVDLVSVSGQPSREVSGHVAIERSGDTVRADAVLEASGDTPPMMVRGSAQLLHDEPASSPAHGIRLRRLAGRVGGVAWRLTRPSTIRWGEREVSVEALTVRSGGSLLSARGRLAGDRVDARLSIRGLEAPVVERVARAAGLAIPPLGGTLSARLHVAGATDRPALSLMVRSPRLTIARAPPIDFRARASSAGAASRIAVDARARGARASLRATLPGNARELLDRIRGEGARAVGFTASVDADLDARALPTSADRRAAGVASLRARAGGDLASPWVEGDVRLSGLTAFGAPALDGQATATWRGRVARMQGRLAARSGGSVAFSGSLEVPEGSEPVLRANVEASRFDPEPLAALASGIEDAGGRIDGDAAVEGPLDALRGHWSVAWVDGSVRTRSYGRYGPFRIEARGDRDGGTVVAEGGAGGGTFTLHATARPHPDGAGGVTLSGVFEAARLPMVRESQLLARVTTRIALSGNVAGGTADVSASIENGVVQLPETSGGSLQALARPEGVVVLSEGGADGDREPVGKETETAPAPASAEPRDTSRAPSWRLVVRTASAVTVHRHDLDLRVVTAPSLRIEERDRLVLFGTLRATSGDVSLGGAQVDAVSGTELRFAGPPEAPFVEIAAARDLTGRGMEVHGRRPGGSTTGPRRHMQLYSLLANGRVEPPRSSAHSSVEGRGWGSALERAFASQVPLGAFLERGTSSRSSDIRSSVTGQVDVGSVSRLAGDPSQDENRRTIRLGVQLRPHLRLEGSSGDAGVSGVDFVWDVLGR